MIFFKHFLVVAAACGLTAMTGCAVDGENPDDGTGEEATAGDEQDFTAGPFACDGIPDTKKVANPRSGALVKVRLASQKTFDRFVMEFAPGTTPDMYFVASEPTTSFTNTAEEQVKVEGEAGIRVVFMAGDSFAPFAGKRRMKLAGGKGIREVAAIEAFEGNIEWAIGTQKAPCFRTTTLQNPPRLVVDVRR